MFALKPLSHDSVAGALAKAERYRLLNEPAEAESICRDILEVEPENQQALICLVLALTDQIAKDSRSFQRSGGGRETARRLRSRVLCRNRLGTARQSAPRRAWTRHASLRVRMDRQGAAVLRGSGTAAPAGNDDALLRWNTCVRFLARHPNLAPRAKEVPEPIVSE